MISNIEENISFRAIRTLLFAMVFLISLRRSIFLLIPTCIAVRERMFENQKKNIQTLCCASVIVTLFDFC